MPQSQRDVRTRISAVKNIEKNLLGVPAAEQRMILTTNCRDALFIDSTN